MRVVITGASGFVGRYVVEALGRRGIGGLLVGRRPAPPVPGFDQATGGLEDIHFARAALDGATHVIHCAGEKAVRERMVATNVEATRNLVSAAKMVGVARFVHLSSVGVIGKVRTALVDERTPCRPMNFYEETKREAESIVAAAGLSGAILRPTNVFGPENVRTLGSGGRLKRFVVGKENAHLVYVGDVAEAVVFALMREGPSMETFIVSSDDERGNTVAEVTARVLDREPQLQAPLWVPYLMRLGRHRHANWGARVYSPRKLANAGFVRPFGLRAGLDASLETGREAVRTGTGP